MRVAWTIAREPTSEIIILQCAPVCRKFQPHLQSEGVFVDEGIRFVVLAGVVEEEDEVGGEFLDIRVLKEENKDIG